MNNLYIPKKIKIGFQKRKDTFTGKLAYVTYFDDKGVLRKEHSWNGWRDSTIESIEYENKPLPNYILNKGVHRHGHFGSGRNVIRIYDPRDFEFEISVDNLLGILLHSDVSKRDINEQCIFAWSGKDLVLLPCNSDEYQNAIAYTKKQTKVITTKDLKPGYQYLKKKSNEILTYIGRYKYYDFESYYGKQTDKGNKHVFYDGKTFVIPSVSTLAIENDYNEEFPSISEKFFNSLNHLQIKEIIKEKASYISKDGYRNIYFLDDITIGLNYSNFDGLYYSEVYCLDKNGGKRSFDNKNIQYRWNNSDSNIYGAFLNNKIQDYVVPSEILDKFKLIKTTFEEVKIPYYNYARRDSKVEYDEDKLKYVFDNLNLQEKFYKLENGTLISVNGANNGY